MGGVVRLGQFQGGIAMYYMRGKRPKFSDRSIEIIEALQGIPLQPRFRTRRFSEHRDEEKGRLLPSHRSFCPSCCHRYLRPWLREKDFLDFRIEIIETERFDDVIGKADSQAGFNIGRSSQCRHSNSRNGSWEQRKQIPARFPRSIECHRG